MNSMSLKNKLILLVTVLLSFCIMIGVVGYNSSNKLAGSFTQIEEETIPQQVSMLEALAHMRSARIYLLQLAMPNLTDAEIKEMREKIPVEITKYDKEAKSTLISKPHLRKRFTLPI